MFFAQILADRGRLFQRKETHRATKFSSDAAKERSTTRFHLRSPDLTHACSLLLPVLLRELELDACYSRRILQTIFCSNLHIFSVQITITRGGGAGLFFTLVSILLDFR